MISLETLMFYGLTKELAELVLNNKITDDIKEKIKDLHLYNLVFLYGKRNQDKDFIIGKIMQLYLQNQQKVLLTNIQEIEYISSIDSDFINLEYYKLLIIREIEIATPKQILLLKMLPSLYKKKTFILDIQNKKDAVAKQIKENLSWSIKTFELEV